MRLLLTTSGKTNRCSYGEPIPFAKRTSAGRCSVYFGLWEKRTRSFDLPGGQALLCWTGEIVRRLGNGHSQGWSCAVLTSFWGCGYSASWHWLFASSAAAIERSKNKPLGAFQALNQEARSDPPAKRRREGQRGKASGKALAKAKGREAQMQLSSAIQQMGVAHQSLHEMQEVIPNQRTLGPQALFRRLLWRSQAWGSLDRWDGTGGEAWHQASVPDMQVAAPSPPDGGPFVESTLTLATPLWRVRRQWRAQVCRMKNAGSLEAMIGSWSRHRAGEQTIERAMSAWAACSSWILRMASQKPLWMLSLDIRSKTKARLLFLCTFELNIVFPFHAPRRC